MLSFAFVGFQGDLERIHLRKLHREAASGPQNRELEELDAPLSRQLEKSEAIVHLQSLFRPSRGAYGKVAVASSNA